MDDTTKEARLEALLADKCNGLDLEVLIAFSEEVGVPGELVRATFKDLEEEGRVFRAKDELSGKELWFPISSLYEKADD